MSNSWNHALEQLSVRELFRLARNDAASMDAYGGDDPTRYRWHGMCSIGRVTHQEPATYEHSYSYVTGRAGRVSWATKLVCAEHAEQAAAKYGIDLAAVPVQCHRTKHASEQAVEAFFGGGGS